MKLLKFFGKRCARKGFTLVELVVVMAIIAILMISVVAFAQPIRAMMSNTNAQNDAIIINNGIGNYIERRLAFANDIKMFVGDTYYSADQQKACEDLYNKHKGTADSPRMMVFDFDSVKGSYKVYDIPITSTSMPLNATALVKNNLVYTDDFFGPYSYFITSDNLNVEVNPAKKKAYLSFRIDSYDFGQEAKQITTTNVADYFTYINNGKTGTNPFDDYVMFRSGSENVSFALENIPVEVKWTDAKKADGTDLLDSEGNKYQVPTPKPISAVEVKRPNTGYCVVIFYNVRKYSVSDIK